MYLHLNSVDARNLSAMMDRQKAPSLSHGSASLNLHVISSLGKDRSD